MAAPTWLFYFLETLQEHPYHVAALLSLSELMGYTGEAAQARGLAAGGAARSDGRTPSLPVRPPP